jgi:O-antigen/teichoic acid export membrane protein
VEGSVWLRVRRTAARVAKTWHTPVYRSSYALIATTIVNAVLGVLFWVAAARLYSARVVGLGAGGISALQLIATIGWVGLIFTLMRYVPIAGNARRRLVLGVYCIGAGTAVVVAIVFSATLAARLSVSYVSSSLAVAAVFCACVGVWVIFTLQDSALISLRRSSVVAVENLLYGALKLVLLVILSGLAKPWALLGVWVGSAVIFVGAVSGFVLLTDPVLRATTTPTPALSKLAIARFSAGHTAAAFMAIVPDYLAPLLVLHYLDPAANAYYYSAWSVSLSARALSVNVTDALIVEASYGQESFSELLQKLARLFAGVLVPTVLCILLGAGLILRMFGSHYAGAGAGVLRYFAIGLIPFTVVTLALALDRVRERFADALLITGVATVTTIGLDVILIPAIGVSGAGLGWLCGQALAAAVALRSLWRGLALPAAVRG